MTLEEEFEKELWRTIDVARKNDYIPSYFMQMLGEYGGVKTAKRLLSKQEIQQGLMTLAEKKLLEFSMEAVVLQEKYISLFEGDGIDYIGEARRRIEVMREFMKGKS